MSKINIYFIIINIISFLFFMIDKIKAKYHLWRIPEKVLFILSFIGGGIGSLISMKTFHHKTKKMEFQILIPFFLIFIIITYIVIKKIS